MPMKEIWEPDLLLPFVEGIIPIENLLLEDVVIAILTSKDPMQAARDTIPPTLFGVWNVHYDKNGSTTLARPQHPVQHLEGSIKLEYVPHDLPTGGY